MKTSQLLTKVNPELPINFVVRYSSTGSSLRVIHGLEELTDYIKARDIAMAQIVSIKELNGTTYVEAASSTYARPY